jgi:agmatine deiminase
MIIDSQTNFLYLADTLPNNYRDFYTRFEKTLKECNIKFDFLPNTKDVWAVDFMPIQVELEKFIEFVYNPSYLQSKASLKTISNTEQICEEIGIETIKTNIVLDGGNVVKTANKVFMTDRVFKDNPSYERKKSITELHELLEIEKLYLLPEQPDDFTGHSDGMIRFIDENTVIVNDYSKEKKEFYRAFEIAVHNTGIECIKIPYNVYNNKSKDNANGDYINYLQMEKLVIIPIFNLKEDEIVIRQFEELFKGQRIVTVESNEIANEGGILNCITWNIKK